MHSEGRGDFERERERENGQILNGTTDPCGDFFRGSYNTIRAMFDVCPQKE